MSSLSSRDEGPGPSSDPTETRSYVRLSLGRSDEEGITKENGPLQSVSGGRVPVTVRTRAGRVSDEVSQGPEVMVSTPNSVGDSRPWL